MAGINFTVGVDGSQYFSGMKNMEATGKSTAKAIQDAFGAKLKSVLSLTAIEEGVRRTGEWAAEIDRASKSLGVTREQLQTIQLIASKTGTSQDAIVGMFDNINKARDEALKGNHELIQSFQRVGVTYDDLLNKTKQGLFSEVLGKVNPNDKNEMMRTSIHNITGTPEGIIAGFKGGMGGQSFEAIQSAGLKSGAVIKEEEVQGIAAQWAGIITSLKDAGAQLIPVAGMLLDLAKVFTDALGGTTEFLKNSIDMTLSLIKGDWAKIGEGYGKIADQSGYLFFGALKATTSLVDMFTNFVSKIPVIGKKLGKSDLTQSARDWEEIYTEKIKGNPETARRFGALGELAGTIGTAGSLSVAGEKAGGIVGKIRSNKVDSASLLQEAYKKVGVKKISKERAFYRSDDRRGRTGMKPSVFEEGGEYFMVTGYDWMPELRSKLKQTMDDRIAGKITMAEESKLISQAFGDINILRKNAVKRAQEQLAFYKDRITNKYKTLGSGFGLIGSVGDIMGTAGRLVAIAQEERDKVMKTSTAAGEARPIFPMWGAAGMGGAPITGGGMLKLGGMFGSGDNKIVKLNIEMVKLLNMIQVNTSPYARAGGGYVVPQTNNMGGASGGL